MSEVVHTGDPKEFASSDEFMCWYEGRRWHHERLARLVMQFLEWQIEDFFRDSRLPVLAKMSYRVKSMDSIKRNFRKRRYRSFPVSRDKFGDLAGVRVVFYFRDDVEHFCDERVKFFRRWFGHRAYEERKVFDATKPKAKRRNTGYESWHFPVRVERDSDFYRALNEIDRFVLEGLDCEVQLRSTLQDAWAEWEHEIRYKAPDRRRTRRDDPVRQAFQRLSLQLHEIDDTAITLKHDYRSNVEQAGRSKRRRRPTRHDTTDWYAGDPAYHRAARIGGVVYGYELLDCAAADGTNAPFLVAPRTSMFHVDSAMEKIAGTKRYKQRMWDRLRREQPALVVAIRYDSIVARATDWVRDTRTLSVELATYSDQLVTNHRAAKEERIPDDPRGRTVHDLAVDESGVLLAFRDSPLSNTIGVSCVIRTSGDRWVVALRSPSVAFDPGAWGCPASCALNWVELGHWERRDFDGWVKTGIIREVEEELGFRANPGDVHYLALAREFGRLGKPQIFFFVDASSIGPDSLSAKFRTYKRLDSGYQGLMTLKTAQVRDLVSDDRDAVRAVSGGAVVGDELRFNLALALDRLENRRWGPEPAEA